MMTEGTKQSLTDAEKNLNDMIQANPNLLTLIQTFDLVSPTGDPLRVVDPITGKQITNEERTKLRRIAGRLFYRGKSYTPEQAIEVIEKELAVSTQRALNGLSMMLTTGILFRTPTGLRLSV